MFIKKFFSSISKLTLSTIILGVIIALNAIASATPKEPEIAASSAILVEASTGRIIYEKNSDIKRAPASMTKMLTCILALENLKPSDEIKISNNAILTEDTTLDCAENDSLRAIDMITAVLLVSENGGAVALAEAIGGDVQNFSDIMNKKARSLSCEHSNFVNPNGLPDNNHYSTAADMARIALYCMKNSNFRKIVSTQHTTINWRSPKDKWAELNNTNKLLGTYFGANGVKTGWTSAAGGCLAASAKRGDVELLVVVMNSTDEITRFDDAKALLNYGFDRVRMVKLDDYDSPKSILIRGGKAPIIHVKPSEDLKFPLLEDEDAKFLQMTYDLPKVINVKNDIDEGKKLGEIVINYDGDPIARFPMSACEKVRAGFSPDSFLISLIAPLMSWRY